MMESQDQYTTPKYLQARWSTVALICALIGAAYLLAAAAHVRLEFVKEDVLVEFKGPLARWAFHLAIAGWVFTALAGALAFLAKDREWGRVPVIVSNTCLTIVTIIVLTSFGYVLLISGMLN
jgi:hypothetical protein